MDVYLGDHITEIIGEINGLNPNQIDKNMIDLIVEYFNCKEIYIPGEYKQYKGNSVNFVGLTGIRGLTEIPPTPCTYCRQLINSYHDLETHRSVCTEWDVQCQSCYQMYPKSKILEHQKGCIYREIPCEYCDQGYRCLFAHNHYAICEGVFQCKDKFYSINLRSLHCMCCDDCQKLDNQSSQKLDNQSCQVM